MKNKLRRSILNTTFRTKLVLLFGFFAIIILIANMMLYSIINRLTNRLEDVYESNVELNELDSTLTLLQASLEEYVSTRSSDSLDNYYRYEQELTNQEKNLNDITSDDEILLAEKNIRGLCESYLKITSNTVAAKRGRNVELYAELSEQATNLEEVIHTYIYSLNNELFKSNSETYLQVNQSVSRGETLSVIVLLAVIAGSLIIISIMTGMMIMPLNRLAYVANEVADGNFDIDLIPVRTHDEVGVVTGAFNQMVGSIKEYIVEQRETMERENEMKERDLMMQSHLKDAQLKYLQAQINPHFLFNTLNAGAQLAMMEDATKTGELLANTAAFFRYNVRNVEDATLGEEIRLVDNYIYICNVRFAGEIIFTKEVDESLADVRVPSMILQPLVENAFNYGIRNIGREGRIELDVFQKDGRIQISVWDNGNGMTQERIHEIMNDEHPSPDPRSTSSNGVGVRNLMERLKLYFEEQATFEMLSEGEGMGTEILISFPDLREGKES